MEATPSDDLAAIAALLKELSVGLVDSREKSKAVEALVVLLCESEAGLLTEAGEEEQLNQEIARLEAERTARVVNLQRLEFVNKQLQVTLTENETAVATTTDFFRARDETRGTKNHQLNLAFSAKVDELDRKIELLRCNLAQTRTTFGRVSRVIGRLPKEP